MADAPPLGPARARLQGQRGMGVLGTAIAVGGVAATAGYLKYSRRERRPVPPGPLKIVRDPEGAGAFGAWRWGLLGLGATAFVGGFLVFMVAA